MHLLNLLAYYIIGPTFIFKRYVFQKITLKMLFNHIE